MRFAVLAAALALSTGCASRSQPYRFASPLLGSADVPTAPLPGTGGDKRVAKRAASRRAAPVRVAGGWQADAQQGAIRSVSARGIETAMPVASAEAASAVTRDGFAREVVWSRLPAPHRTTSAPEQPSGIAAAVQLPRLREPSDLRALVGQRDKRDPFEIVTSWLADLDLRIDSSATDGPALVLWAQDTSRLAAPTDIARPGDLLVFDRALGEEPADLLAIAVGRDARGVTEFIYAGGGVIRRGFLDPTRMSLRRDVDGLVLNTFLRHGKRWPPPGTRYLAGELLTHVIRTR
jgi:hypothetical protein